MDLLHSVRGARGQATSEYVALIALVAVALALAAGLTSGGLGGQVLAGLQRGLCRVTGGACPRPAAPGPDLAPCPLQRSVSMEQLGGALAFVRLGSDETLTAARMSDGRVTVMLTHGGSAGGELRVGASVGVGTRSLSATARADAGAVWTSGRAWTFADAAAARRFVGAYGAKATVGGRIVDELRSRCSLLCDALGWHPHPQLPEPDETYEEGGALGALKASFGFDGTEPVALGAERNRVIGRRIRRDGTTTWYLRLDETAGAAMDLPFGRLSRTAAQQSVVSYTLDPHGHPTTLGVLVAQEGAGETGATAPRGMHAAVGSGGGAVIELEGTLDLRDPANRPAAAGLLDSLRGRGTLADLARRAHALAARLALHGQVDRRTYALATSARSTGATVGLGLEVGGAVERSTRSMRLLSAETRLPGLPFLPRDDCRPA
ncbi:MAG TPA: hypothetical protein VE972_10830 [Conexibacter sp.]|nr:hypothetical protein [Conexibacter sp.]